LGVKEKDGGFMENEGMCCVCDFNGKMVEGLDVFGYISILLENVVGKVI